ncbi:GNAT family N-acetyltransferase [Streptomyces platensis]|uniref:GNAT family N-acetyltransferase n=1 Tax=Streptomyces platensis TaxID=58346 RepID=UPI00332155D5
MGDLLTAQLVLHPITVSEAEQLMAGQPDSKARGAPGYPTDGNMTAARHFPDTYADTGNPQPSRTYEIRRHANSQTTGGLGFHGPADENGSVTIGYGLIQSARGKGYASEALRGLLLFAKRTASPA